MNRFIETDDGSYLNLSHVARVAYNNVGQRLFYSAAGTVMGKEPATNPLPIFDSLGELIPAASGAHAVVIWDGSERGSKPKIEDLVIEYPAIVAWRVLGDEAEPVFTERRLATDLVFIRDHDGTLRLRDEGTYRGTEEALAAALAIFQQRAPA